MLDFDGPFLRFVGLIGQTTWSDRAAQIRRAIAGNAFSKEYLEEDNELCFALEELSSMREEYGRFPLKLRKKRHLFFAMAFVTQTVSLFDAVDEMSGKQLVQRIIGAIKNDPDDVRAIQVELAMATHFLASGHKITFPDLEGEECFDLLVHGIGNSELEVECKFVSSDKGHKIHRAELLDFYQMVAPALNSYIAIASADLIVEVTVPDRFPSSMQTKKILAGMVSEAINGNTFILNEEIAHIDIREATLMGLGSTAHSGRLDRAYLDQVTGTNNKPMLLLGKQGGRVLLMVVKSQKDDTILKSIYKTLSRAASEQLTGHRPALLVAGLQNIDVSSLIRVAGHEMEPESKPNGLQRIATKLMQGSHRDHVVSVCFLSENEVGERAGGITPSGGAVYHFENNEKKDSQFWKPEYGCLFAPIS